MSPGRRVLGRAISVPPAVVAAWAGRRTQIYPAETYAVLAALYEHREELKARDVLLFVDIDAAAASIIRGAPRKEDVGLMVHLIHILPHTFSMRLRPLEFSDNVGQYMCIKERNIGKDVLPTFAFG